MKCIGCGAEITDQDLECPYCGKANLEAKKRAEELDKILTENKRLKKQVLSSSGKVIFYKIHKKVNLVLFVACIIAAVVGIAIYTLQSRSSGVGKADLAKVREFYNSGNLEELYLHLSDAYALQEKEYEEYARAAILWKQYRECQNDFAKSLDKYNSKGEYDSYYLRKSVEEGYQVLTNYVKMGYYDDEVSDKTKDMLKEYKENVIALFTGIYQIPIEKIDGFDKYSVSVENELEKYVSEVLNGK